MHEKMLSGTATVEFTVNADMTARLEGIEIHRVCSTFWMVYYAEVAARKAIEPFFDSNEDAVGAGICLTHRAMAAVGAIIVVSARVLSIEGHLVTCTIEARSKNTNTLLAEGIQNQVVMRTEIVQSKVANAVR